MSFTNSSGRPFRFAIMGAGHIAGKFTEAARLAGAEVAAVASKSHERAEAFATAHDIPSFYDSYAQMLAEIRPDCVYIATTPHQHFALSALCLDHWTPVLCEKAMFLSHQDAACIFSRSEVEGVFVMEAMWSKFLPALNQVKAWMDSGRIGRIMLVDFGIGFAAPGAPESRYFNPSLGGGATSDITVYAYEITRFLLGGSPDSVQLNAVWDYGVDVTDTAILRFGETTALLKATLTAPIEERLAVYGTAGKIVVPGPHYASTATLFPASGDAETFADTETKNGFVYEILETMRCIRAGLTESPVHPHSETLACAALFDQINALRG